MSTDTPNPPKPIKGRHMQSSLFQRVMLGFLALCMMAGCFNRHRGTYAHGFHGIHLVVHDPPKQFQLSGEYVDLWKWTLGLESQQLQLSELNVSGIDVALKVGSESEIHALGARLKEGLTQFGEVSLIITRHQLGSGKSVDHGEQLVLIVRVLKRYGPFMPRQTYDVVSEDTHFTYVQLLGENGNNNAGSGFDLTHIGQSRALVGPPLVPIRVVFTYLDLVSKETTPMLLNGLIGLSDFEPLMRYRVSKRKYYFVGF